MPNIPPLRRFFQPQVPQLLRPTMSSILARTVGRVNLEFSTKGLDAVAYWSDLRAGAELIQPRVL